MNDFEKIESAARSFEHLSKATIGFNSESGEQTLSELHKSIKEAAEILSKKLKEDFNRLSPNKPSE